MQYEEDGFREIQRSSTKFGALGSRSGWWGVSSAAEAFLDQLVTWRELGFNMCWQAILQRT